jgi:predicted secreted hydrolase
MPAAARWLAAAAGSFLVIGAFVYLLSHWAGREPVPSGTAGVLDWAGALDRMFEGRFDPPRGAWELTLPKDHGAHPDARTESWTVSAHLRDTQGEAIGVQFALLRVGLVPHDAPERASPWETRAIYRGHVTFVERAVGAAAGEERFQRDVPGIADHDAERREVWIDHWTIRYGTGEKGDGLALEATVGVVEIGLTLKPAKPALALNEGGGPVPFRGYAITRMEVEGDIGTGDDRRPVSGLAWLDHLWGDVPLPVGPIVFDRLQLHLDDGTDLSVTRTRRRDGGGSTTLAGFAVDPAGRTAQIEDTALEMEATRRWSREVPDAGYPVAWRLRAGAIELDLAPVVDDQLHDFRGPFWGGMVEGSGSVQGVPVSGFGTLLVSEETVR